MKLKPYLRIDDKTTLHLARPELVQPIFNAVDEQRDYLRQWLPWVDGTQTIEDTETFIKESMEHNSKGDQLSTFILYGEKLAGSLSVVRYQKGNKSCEIGYWLHKDLQGHGIMTKAVKGFVNHLFKTKALNRIEIHAATNNTKSQAIPTRLGFQKEGVLRQAILMYDQFYDRVLFGLLREEWQKWDA
jgi:ribosomal-protein-serine acetyltransferase